MKFPILKSHFNFSEWTFLILRNNKFSTITILRESYDWDKIVTTSGENVIYANESTYTLDGKHVLEIERIEINPEFIP